MSKDYSACMTLEYGLKDNNDTTDNHRRHRSLAFGNKFNEKYFGIFSFSIDFFILIASLSSMIFILRGSHIFETRNIKMSLIFIGAWFLISMISNKYDFKVYQNFKQGLFRILKSSAIITYFMAVLFVLFGFYSPSRVQTFGICLIFCFLETITFLVYCNLNAIKISFDNINVRDQINQKVRFSFRYLIVDFIGITTSFFLLYYFNHDSLNLSIEYQKLLILYYGVWFSIGLFTRKFENRRYKNILYTLAPFFKAFLLMFSLMAIFVYGLHLFYFSRLQIFGSFFILLILESISLFIIYLRHYDHDIEGDVGALSEVKKMLEDEEESDATTTYLMKNEKIKQAVKKSLKEKYLSRDKILFKFINRIINLNLIDENRTKVMGTDETLNIQHFNNHSLRLFINLNRINDLRYINRFFLEVHRKIYNSGYFVGVAHTTDTHENWLKQKYPRWIFKLVYPLDFIFHRILPKLSFTSKLYFFITKGRSQVLSKAEIFGRLHFCGFRVIAEKDINNRLYFVAQRLKKPSIEKNPSYGPVIQLKRIGYGGDLMYVRKFRTMHPYSEFLQDYIYKQHQLKKNGKFNSDFRITEWGKWFRKLWIDEIPQIINYLQGDISLVGVRALSKQYFNLYPKDLQELRTQFKPGLIPPYYADLPNSLEEIIESEKKYLNRKLNRRISTDFCYFCKAFYNIVIKKARSN